MRIAALVLIFLNFGCSSVEKPSEPQVTLDSFISIEIMGRSPFSKDSKLLKESEKVKLGNETYLSLIYSDSQGDLSIGILESEGSGQVVEKILFFLSGKRVDGVLADLGIDLSSPRFDKVIVKCRHRNEVALMDSSKGLTVITLENDPSKARAVVLSTKEIQSQRRRVNSRSQCR